MAIGAHTVSGGKQHIGRGILQVGMGVICLYFFLVGIAFHIRTTEAMLLGQSGTGTISFSLDTLAQPVLLAQQRVSGNVAATALTAWVIEIIFLTISLIWDASILGIRKSASWLVGLFVTYVVFIVGLDMYSDYQFTTLASGSRLLFMLVAAFCVLFCGLIGEAGISHGIRNIRGI